MLNLLFRTTGQALFIKVDRTLHKVWIKSHKTNYEWQEKPYSYLFDEGVYWANVKIDKVNLKAIPIKISELKKDAKLRQKLKLNREQIKTIEHNNKMVVKNAMCDSESWNDEKFKRRIIAWMSRIGYVFDGEMT